MSQSEGPSYFPIQELYRSSESNFASASRGLELRVQRARAQLQALLDERRE